MSAGVQQPPDTLSAGGPSSITLLGKRPSLTIHVKESCWVKVTCEQPNGDHSIFVSVYREGDKSWNLESSGCAQQTLEGYVLEIYLEPSEKPYLVVASSTLDQFGADFSMRVESTSELLVREE